MRTYCVAKGTPLNDWCDLNGKASEKEWIQVYI